jgi:hypothetical protein
MIRAVDGKSGGSGLTQARQRQDIAGGDAGRGGGATASGGATRTRRCGAPFVAGVFTRTSSGARRTPR